MKYFLFAILLTFYSIPIQAQISNLKEKCELPKELKETSGLIYFNGRMISHNDSGSDPILYEIDSTSGEILREVWITNVDNEDWEDITHDEDYIYIADFGNNNGDRKDLKIYRIAKVDFESKNEVEADVINFIYEDQFDFTSQHHMTNFDAEALCVYGEDLIIFTKNWLDNKTKVYTLPKFIGTHIAKKKGSFETQGLVTGVSYDKEYSRFMICGYDVFLQAFVGEINGVETNEFDGGIFVRTDITPIIGIGSQVEGICSIGNGRYFLSREKFKKTINGATFKFPQKLYAFSHQADGVGTSNVKKDSFLELYPNPVSGQLILIAKRKGIEVLELIDTKGQMIKSYKDNIPKAIDVSNMVDGIYFMRVKFGSDEYYHYKFIKH